MLSRFHTVFAVLFGLSGGYVIFAEPETSLILNLIPMVLMAIFAYLTAYTWFTRTINPVGFTKSAESPADNFEFLQSILHETPNKPLRSIYCWPGGRVTPSIAYLAMEAASWQNALSHDPAIGSDRLIQAVTAFIRGEDAPNHLSH